MLQSGYTPVQTPLTEIPNMLINVLLLTDSFTTADFREHGKQNAIIFS
jgi:hypothetical protein